MRTYVKGTNPQTPLQQANRAVFSQAVVLSQQAIAINKGLGHFDTTDTPEFALRVSACRSRIKAGLDSKYWIPLQPYPWTPYSNVISLNSFIRLSPGAYLAYSMSSSKSGRTYNLRVYCYNTTTHLWETVYLTGTNSATTLFYCQFSLPTKYIFPAGSQFCAISNDDVAKADNGVVCYPLAVSIAGDIV